jgi:hypothetical protein
VFFIIALNILLIFGTIQEFDSKELLPILESGFWRTVWASRQNDTDWAMATIMAIVKQIIPQKGLLPLQTLSIFDFLLHMEKSPLYIGNGCIVTGSHKTIYCCMYANGTKCAYWSIYTAV